VERLGVRVVGAEIAPMTPRHHVLLRVDLRRRYDHAAAHDARHVVICVLLMAVRAAVIRRAMLARKKSAMQSLYVHVFTIQQARCSACQYMFHGTYGEVEADAASFPRPHHAAFTTLRCRLMPPVSYRH